MPTDVFISYKNLTASGQPTRDSEIARVVFDYFREKQLTPFFSGVSLEEEGSDKFRRAIDEALEAADVMVIVATAAEHLRAQWVAYEWDTFQQSIFGGKKPSGRIFIYGEGIEPADLPTGLQTYQTINHTGLESLGRLYNFVSRGQRKPEDGEASLLAWRERPGLEDLFSFLRDLDGKPPNDTAATPDFETRYFVGSNNQTPLFRSPTFLPYADPSGKRSDLAELLSRWLPRSHASSSLMFISHFGPDAREILIYLAWAITNQMIPNALTHVNAQWIWGDELMALSDSSSAGDFSLRAGFGQALFQGFQASQESVKKAFDQIQNSPPTVFLVDFSTAFVPGPPAADGPTTKAAAALQAVNWFCNHVRAAGHSVVVAFPRCALMLPAVRAMAQNAAQADSCFITGELFSSRLEETLERCRSIFGEIPLPKVLEPLLCIDSNLVAFKIAWYLKTHRAEVLGDSNSDFSPRLAMMLAANLWHQGFHEVAYRLELFARTSAMAPVANQITVAADIKPLAEQRADVVGLIEGLENIPRVTTRAALTGAGGSGKTYALQQIHQTWALPRLTHSGRQFSSWLPIYIPLSDRPAEKGVDRRLCVPTPQSFQDNENESYRLLAHTWLEHASELADLQWLFSSKVMFLLDGFDRLSDDDQLSIESHLEETLSAYPEAGLVVAVREGSGPTALLQQRIQVRPLNELQLRQYLTSKLEQPFQNRTETIERLLGIIDRPISRLVRNPYLLEKVYQLADRMALEELNLYQLMTEYVESRRSEHDSAHARRIVYQWLPELALQQKKDGDFSSDDQAKTTRFAKQAWEMGFLRSPQQPVQFVHDVLRDYFAARKLADDFTKDGPATFDGCRLTGEVFRDWEDLFRVLIGHLNQDQKDANQSIGTFIDWLGSGNLRLAVQCALELPLSRARAIPAVVSCTHTLTERIVGRKPLQNEVELTDAIADGDALGCLDPRIGLSDPLQGTVEIVSRPSFRIGRFPVTNLDFAMFIADGGYAERNSQRWWKPFAWERLARTGTDNFDRPRYWRNHLLNKPNQPVVGISFFEALAYCAWLSEKVWRATSRNFHFRLPNEADWLRALGIDRVRLTSRLTQSLPGNAKIANAASAVQSGNGASRKSNAAEEIHSLFGEIDRSLSPYRFQLGCSGNTPVGLFPPTVTGCFDLLGNVWEWCDEWHPRTAENRPSSVESNTRQPITVKGGPTSGQMSDASILYGGWFDPFTRFHKIGFRICCDSDNVATSTYER